jgi:hypothetical protein
VPQHAEEPAVPQAVQPVAAQVSQQVFAFDPEATWALVQQGQSWSEQQAPAVVFVHFEHFVQPSLSPQDLPVA